MNEMGDGGDRESVINGFMDGDKRILWVSESFFKFPDCVTGP